MVRTLRTRIYIDGYNLYYGCLSKSPYKWLDVLKLFEERILPSILYKQDIDSEPDKMVLLQDNAIKYFTADILEKAAKSHDSVSSQTHYHNALTKHCGNRVSFIRGYYATYKAKQAVISADKPDRWPRDCDKIQVWKIEEKQSDVNLALEIYDDALQDEVDQVVLVTNDTDLVPAFKLLKKRCPNIVRGLVVPTRKVDGELERQPNKSLLDLANWVRSSIHVDELKAAQLPDVVIGGRKPSIKPNSWYARPDNLVKMLELARPVMQKDNETMKWARQNNNYLNGKSPIELIETDQGASKVFEYIENYVKDKLKNNDNF